jgi:hypothetical protein
MNQICFLLKDKPAHFLAGKPQGLKPFGGAKKNRLKGGSNLYG